MKILFITHRVPYPPDKGEKIRAFHIIEYLSKFHEIYLYSLSDNNLDKEHAEALKRYCKAVNLYYVSRFQSIFRALFCLFSHHPFTLAFFYSSSMKRDIRNKLKQFKFDIIFAYSASSAQFVIDQHDIPKIIDFVDVDSDKWINFSKKSNFFNAFVYKMEHIRIRKWEIKVHLAFNYSIVCTEYEKEKLASNTKGNKKPIYVMRNWVDSRYFKYEERKSDSNKLVFTGQMNYLPNVDAALFFCRDIFTIIKRDMPYSQFYIVGRSPSKSIKSCCKDAVITDYVKDIRKYLYTASVYIAPLRIAQGVQTKILEAMACGVPVVCTSKVLKGLEAIANRDVLVGDKPDEFANQVLLLLKNKEMRKLLAKNGLELIKLKYNKKDNAKVLDNILKRCFSGHPYR